MRTHAFVQVVAAGIIASTYGLEINKTDPAALEMGPATDGFAQADAQTPDQTPIRHVKPWDHLPIRDRNEMYERLGGVAPDMDRLKIENI